MSAAVAVVGTSGAATQLVRHAAPVKGVVLASWSPAEPGDDAEEFARRTGATLVPDWRRAVRDPASPVVLVLAPPSHRSEIVRAALAAGKLVLCPFPVATDAAELAEIARAEQGGGVLRMVGGIADTPAGGLLLQALQDGRLGTVHSLWAAARVGRSDGAGADVRETLLWPLLDLVLAGVAGQVQRVHTTAGAVFGPGPAADSAVVLLRFADGPLTTLEVARCLPATLPVPPGGEVEIEAIGTREVVRIAPYATTVQVFGENAAGASDWTDPPLARALEKVPGWLAGRERDVGWEAHARRALAVMQAVLAGGTRVP